MTGFLVIPAIELQRLEGTFLKMRLGTRTEGWVCPEPATSKKPEDVVGENGLLKRLTKALLAASNHPGNCEACYPVEPC